MRWSHAMPDVPGVYWLQCQYFTAICFVDFFPPVTDHLRYALFHGNVTELSVLEDVLGEIQWYGPLKRPRTDARKIRRKEKRTQQKLGGPAKQGS